MKERQTDGNWIDLCLNPIRILSLSMPIHNHVPMFLFTLTLGDYCRDDDGNTVTEPQKILDNWPEGMWIDIDAAINWGNGFIYFFKGTKMKRSFCINLLPSLKLDHFHLFFLLFCMDYHCNYCHYQYPCHNCYHLITINTLSCVIPPPIIVITNVTDISL